MIHGHGGNINEVARQINCDPSLPWSVNSLAQLAINYICDHSAMIRSFISETRAYITDQKQQFHRAVGQTDRFRLFNGQTPFVLIRPDTGLSDQHVWQNLARDKILIRRCSNIKRLSEKFIRISLKKKDENRLLASRLIDLSQVPDTETGTLKELQVAC
jgi:threonine-phosphate decarboxylase